MGSLFSIVIPTFNSRRYSPECVASTLSQTYQNIEVIVDDNASSDGTCEEIRKSSGKDSRLRVLANKEDLNIPNGWNRGFGHSRGDWVMLLHSDNLLHPEYVDTVLSFLGKFSAKIAYTECYYFEGETPANLFSLDPKKGEIRCDYLSGGPRTVDYVFRFQRMIPISCVTIHRTCLKNKPAFNPEYQWDPDMELMLRLLRENTVVHLHAPLVGIRTHKDQAPCWKDSRFSKQYRDLLLLQQQESKTENYQFLFQWANSNQDICGRLSQIHAPISVQARYSFRWFLAELRVLLYFAKHFARKLKLLFSTLFFRYRHG